MNLVSCKKKYFYYMVGGMVINGNLVNMVYLLYVCVILF